MRVPRNIYGLRSAGPRLIVAILTVFFVLPAARMSAQTPKRSGTSDALHSLNDSIEALVRNVSPSVVQIVVRGYGVAKEDERGQTNLVIGRQRAIGSGVIVDPQGYIVTNAHVVKGAQQIDVLVPSMGAGDVPSAMDERGQTFQARVVGTSSEIDLAVLKIDATGLPALPIRASNVPKQGEMVFAFGSPEGLRNTVTMGVISSVARQPDPDSPLVYVQTDTPINPGNSGGPLVDADGSLIGINTFILTTSGGNQGLGFAIPAGELAYAYPQLLKFGHIHQPELGAIIQTITPELAAGLHLQRDFGVIVSDVLPNGPADTSGLKVQDVILSVDGISIGSLPLLTHSLYMHKSGERVKMEILRGSEHIKLEALLVDRPHKADSLSEIADPAKNLVRPLGILGVELNFELLKEFPDLRFTSGVVVAAKTSDAADREVPLQTGDVIHALNGTPITDLAGLRSALAALKTGDAVVLQIERYGQLIYVSFAL